MERFDIVDKNGTPTGAVCTREDAHARGLRHRTAHIWVVRKVDGRYEVLLQKRAANKDSFPGCYDTSSAGHIQAGDEPLESAVRELGEELGIRAKPEELQFAGTFRVEYEKEFHGKMFRDNEIAFVHVYSEVVDIDGLILQSEEVERVDWFDLEEVIRECGTHNPKFCVPRAGLETVRTFLRQT